MPAGEPRPLRLTAARVRGMLLAAQGLVGRRPSGRVDVRHFRRVLGGISLVQIDSVNVLARAHYLPFFSRLGAYDRAALDRWLWRSRELFEYWGHEASLLPIGDWPLFGFRRRAGRHWRSVERLGAEHPGYIESVLAEVRLRGPLKAGEVDGARVSEGAWWDWSKAKLALEYLFLTGQVAVAHRENFARLYDVPERVIPAEVLAADDVDGEEARRRLLLRAARSLGAGTAADIADYFRMRVPEARPILARLAAEGALRSVEVAGWRGPVYAHPDATIPRRVVGRALLSPFDPVVWNRDRTERLFDFRYRIEIYVPAAKRVHGYYVLPFLLDGRLVARVDLKADRERGRLVVRAAHGQPGIDRVRVARELLAELETMAGWLSLDTVEVESRGDLAPAMRGTTSGALSK